MIAPRIAVLQDGSRLHYGLPLALHHAGILDVMFTDFFIRSGSLWDAIAPFFQRFGPAPFRRMLERRAPGLRGARVCTSLLRRLVQDCRRRVFRSEAAYFRWQAHDNASWIAGRLRPPANVLLGFIRNLDPDLCRLARQRGMRTVGDQIIAPALIEQREARLQQARFPGWEANASSDLDSFIELERATWQQLDAITTPSDYVAQGLREMGISADRIHPMFYPVDEGHFPFVDRAGRGGPVRVGFVGQINLRKGVPYFVEVAKRFPRAHVQFTLVGRSCLQDSVNAEIRKHVDAFSVTRSEVPAQLASFDLIYFPTTCEGSASALMEAMSSGLPVVTSPNSGTVARDGQEGFICPYDDLDAATDRIERLVSDPQLRLSMGRAAHRRYHEFGQDRYSAELAALCERLLATARPCGAL